MQLDIYDDEMDTDETTIDTANEQGRVRGRFRRPEEYEGYQPEVQESPRSKRDPKQVEIDFEEEETDG